MSAARPFAAIVLAAGAGRRLGGNKALMLVGGRTALARVVGSARAAGAADVIVVTGHERDEVAELARQLGAREARNPDPERGMASSVRVGVAAADATLDLLVWPVDHPFVRSDTAAAVVAAADGCAVVPTHGGRGGHPVLLPAAWRAALVCLDEHGRLDHLIRSRPEQVRRLPTDDAGVLRDVDVPADLFDDSDDTLAAPSGAI